MNKQRKKREEVIRSVFCLSNIIKKNNKIESKYAGSHLDSFFFVFLVVIRITIVVFFLWGFNLFLVHGYDMIYLRSFLTWDKNFNLKHPKPRKTVLCHKIRLFF